MDLHFTRVHGQSGKQQFHILTGAFMVLLLIAPTASANDVCGDFLKLSSSTVGQFATLNYPASYPNYAYCSWLLEAPSNYSVVVNISAIDMGNQVNGVCPDYVHIQDGDGTTLLHECSTNATEVVQSSNRWLWLYYKSDGNNTYPGFVVDYYATYTGAADVLSPIDDCQGVSFVCRNKKCIPGAYRCDYYNDCGCTGSGCDESNCGGLNWTEQEKLICGTLVGGSVFVTMFLGIGFLELYLKKRQENENLRQIEEEKRRSRRRRPPPKSKSVEPAPDKDKDTISTTASIRT